MPFLFFVLVRFRAHWVSGGGARSEIKETNERKKDNVLE